MKINFFKYKSKIDKVFNKYSLSYVTNSTNQLILNRCPFCNKPNKLYIDTLTCYWICFHCNSQTDGGGKGSIISLISSLEKINKKSVIQYLQDGGYVLSSYNINQKKLIEEVEEEKREEDFHTINVEFPKDFKNFLFTETDVLKYRRFYEYLAFRGLTREVVDYFKIMFSTYQERIIFPVFYNSLLVGWQARTIYPNIKPKILSQPFGYKKSKFLFNFDNVVEREDITIVEGPIDCCKTYKYGGVALFGKKISKTQYHLIRSLKKLNTVYVALDPEEGSDIVELYKLFSPFYKVKRVEIELGKDCGDKTLKEIDFYIKNSIDFNCLEIIKKNIKSS